MAASKYGRTVNARTVSWDEFQKEKSSRSSAKKTKDEPEYIKREKSIKYVVKDGFFTSIKSGFTENYLMPFAIAMNASNGMLAALVSVPQLVANFFQLFSQESLSFFKTRRRLIVYTAFIQAFMWLPFIFIPFFAKDAVWLILLFATLETMLGTFQGPIYNSILGDIVSEDKRGEFFGRRNRIVNMINFISTLAAGFMLNHFKSMDVNGPHYVFFGFGILFIIATVSRCIAAYYKSKIYDPEFKPKKIKVSFFSFIQNMTHNNYGIFVLFVFLFKLASSISAPFFALYILRDLNMNYMYFTLLLGISIVASVLSMSLWGKLIDKHGSKFVLTISGFLIPISPLLMILAIYIKNPAAVLVFLLIEEAFSGFVWAGFNLSTSSFLFDATSKDERVKYISYYNFIVGIGVSIGAFIGGILIEAFPIWLISTIPYVLLTSGLLRILSTVFMIQKVREARMVEIDFAGRGFFYNVVSINPRFNNHIDIISPYEGRQHYIFHKILPTKPKRKTIDPVLEKERELYYKKSLELYKSGAIQTMKGAKDAGQKDDSYRIEKDIEKNKKKIQEMADSLRKK
jgi:MFS family permease